MAFQLNRLGMIGSEWQMRNPVTAPDRGKSHQARIYSSLTVYQKGSEGDPCRSVYDRCLWFKETLYDRACAIVGKG
jgi:hypothetical protein